MGAVRLLLQMNEVSSTRLTRRGKLAFTGSVKPGWEIHTNPAGKYCSGPVGLMFNQTFWHMSSLCLGGSLDSCSLVG